MKHLPRLARPRSAGIGMLAVLAAAAPPAIPSDHGDTPLLQMLGRQDANVTDLHAFVDDGDLVLAVSTNPAIPPGLTSYLFPSDLTIEIHVDNDSAMRFDDPTAVATFGGTVVDPKRIHSDVRFRITFDRNGNPQLSIQGMRGDLHRDVQMFAGLRDDPFIRGPRIGRNIASVVLKMPLGHVVKKQPALLLWATTEVPSIAGPLVDLAGRSLRSMMPEWQVMNAYEPRFHEFKLGMVPDVMIYDTSRAAAFPNGRALGDDVVDLVGDPRVLGNDAPFPATNDVPFLAAFPYLAPPQ